jgi:hypothetical protein
MRRLLLLLPLVPALTLMSGCGDSGIYYQTRYIPTSIDSAFAIESATWFGDSQVIELPASPPDLEGEHRARADCAYPYQKFKPIAVVGVGEEQVRSLGGGSLQELAATDSRVHPIGPGVAMKGAPFAAQQNSPYTKGLTNPSMGPDVADTDRRPRSVTGGVQGGDPAGRGGFNWNYNPYCCGEHELDPNQSLKPKATPAQAQ